MPNVHLPAPGAEKAEVEQALGKPIAAMAQQKELKEIKVLKKFVSESRGRASSIDVGKQGEPTDVVSGKREWKKSTHMIFPEKE